MPRSQLGGIDLGAASSDSEAWLPLRASEQAAVQATAPQPPAEAIDRSQVDATSHVPALSTDDVNWAALRAGAKVYPNLPPPDGNLPLLPAKAYGYYTEKVLAGRRFVIGEGGEAYYTPDDHASFVPMNELARAEIGMGVSLASRTQVTKTASADPQEGKEIVTPSKEFIRPRGQRGAIDMEALGAWFKTLWGGKAEQHAFDKAPGGDGAQAIAGEVPAALSPAPDFFEVLSPDRQVVERLSSDTRVYSLQPDAVIEARFDRFFDAAAHGLATHAQPWDVLHVSTDWHELDGLRATNVQHAGAQIVSTTLGELMTANGPRARLLQEPQRPHGYVLVRPRFGSQYAVDHPRVRHLPPEWAFDFARTYLDGQQASGVMPTPGSPGDFLSRTFKQAMALVRKETDGFNAERIVNMEEVAQLIQAALASHAASSEGLASGAITGREEPFDPLAVPVLAPAQGGQLQAVAALPPQTRVYSLQHEAVMAPAHDPSFDPSVHGLSLQHAWDTLRVSTDLAELDHLRGLEEVYRDKRIISATLDELMLASGAGAQVLRDDQRNALLGRDAGHFIIARPRIEQPRDGNPPPGGVAVGIDLESREALSISKDTHLEEAWTVLQALQRPVYLEDFNLQDGAQLQETQTLLQDVKRHVYWRGADEFFQAVQQRAYLDGLDSLGVSGLARRYESVGPERSGLPPTFKVFMKLGGDASARWSEPGGPTAVLLAAHLRQRVEDMDQALASPESLRAMQTLAEAGQEAPRQPELAFHGLAWDDLGRFLQNGLLFNEENGGVLSFDWGTPSSIHHPLALVIPTRRLQALGAREGAGLGGQAALHLLYESQPRGIATGEFAIVRSLGNGHVLPVYLPEGWVGSYGAVWPH